MLQQRRKYENRKNLIKKKEIEEGCLIEFASLLKLLTCACNLSFSLLKYSINSSAAVMSGNKQLSTFAGS